LLPDVSSDALLLLTFTGKKTQKIAFSMVISPPWYVAIQHYGAYLKPVASSGILRHTIDFDGMVWYCVQMDMENNDCNAVM